MKEQYQEIRKALLNKKINESRNDLSITQEEMAHRLSMAVRSYIDLEHGKTGGSALTLALYLIYLCPDPTAFLAELKESFDKVSKETKR